MSCEIYRTKSIRNINKLLQYNDIAKYLLPTGVDDPKIILSRLMRPELVIYAMRVCNRLAGMAFFLKEPDGKVRVDEAFVPEVRGKLAKELALSTLDKYINDERPSILKGEIVKENKRALVFAGWMGFKVVEQDDSKFYVERQI